MKMHAFNVTICGWGMDADEAWEAAIEGARLEKIDGAELEFEIVDEEEEDWRYPNQPPKPIDGQSQSVPGDDTQVEDRVLSQRGLAYNHAFTFGFSISGSVTSDGSDVTGSWMRARIIECLASLSDDEIINNCDSPFDTFVELRPFPKPEQRSHNVTEEDAQ